MATARTYGKTATIGNLIAAAALAVHPMFVPTTFEHVASTHPTQAAEVLEALARGSSKVRQADPAQLLWNWSVIRRIGPEANRLPPQSSIRGAQGPRAQAYCDELLRAGDLRVALTCQRIYSSRTPVASVPLQVVRAYEPPPQLVSREEVLAGRGNFLFVSFPRGINPGVACLRVVDGYVPLVVSGGRGARDMRVRLVMEDMNLVYLMDADKGQAEFDGQLVSRSRDQLRRALEGESLSLRGVSFRRLTAVEIAQQLQACGRGFVWRGYSTPSEAAVDDMVWSVEQMQHPLGVPMGTVANLGLSIECGPAPAVRAQESDPRGQRDERGEQDSRPPEDGAGEPVSRDAVALEEVVLGLRQRMG